MKNFKKGFTLVEMLIVVVIIGILSAALLPRLQGAQSAARDSARRSDLSQLWSAILSYYNNRGEYPWLDKDSAEYTTWGTGMIPANLIKEKLMEVVELSSLPTDPNRSNYISFDEAPEGSVFKDQDEIGSGQYGYIRMMKNTIRDGWYLLMARTETEWWSNFLSTIKVDKDLKNFGICTAFEYDEDATPSESASGGVCTYKTKWELRYVYVF